VCKVTTAGATGTFIGITVDALGHGETVAPFWRLYEPNTIIAAVAPASAGGQTFVCWKRNGAAYSSDRIISFAMDADYDIEAVYSSVPFDTTSPVVAIVSPTDGLTVGNNIINVSGTSSDPGNPNSGVVVVEVCVNAGSWQAAAQSPTWDNWSTNVLLSAGSNLIEARARDNAGNFSNTASVTVTYNPPDTTNPTVTMTSPTNGQTFVNPNIAVNGTSSDPGSPSSGVAVVQVRVNSGSWQTATASPTWNTWTKDVVLSPGSNHIEARATDNAGNLSSIAEVTVTYNPPDTTDPTVSITNPTNGQTLVNPSITVSGTSSDQGSPSSGVASVEVRVNNAAWQLAVESPDWSSWSKEISLSQGSNTIEARSQDHAGNYSSPVLISVLLDAADCNHNGISDSVDIATGTSQDCNGNAKPDECDVRGDFNGDGSLTTSDIGPFCQALLGLSQGCTTLADVNRDGVVDGGDIQAFVDKMLTVTPALFSWSWDGSTDPGFIPSQSDPSSYYDAINHVLRVGYGSRNGIPGLPAEFSTVFSRDLGVDLGDFQVVIVFETTVLGYFVDLLMAHDLITSIPLGNSSNLGAHLYSGQFLRTSLQAQDGGDWLPDIPIAGGHPQQGKQYRLTIGRSGTNASSMLEWFEGGSWASVGTAGPVQMPTLDESMRYLRFDQINYGTYGSVSVASISVSGTIGTPPP
jgi:hypothetical protein